MGLDCIFNHGSQFIGRNGVNLGALLSEIVHKPLVVNVILFLLNIPRLQFVPLEMLWLETETNQSKVSAQSGIVFTQNLSDSALTASWDGVPTRIMVTAVITVIGLSTKAKSLAMSAQYAFDSRVL